MAVAISILFAGCGEMDEPETSTTESEVTGCDTPDFTWPMPSAPGIYTTPVWHATGFTYPGSCPWYAVAEITQTAFKSYTIEVPDPGIYLSPTDCANSHTALIVEGRTITGWSTLSSQTRYGTYQANGQWCSLKLDFSAPAAWAYSELRVSSGTWTPSGARPVTAGHRSLTHDGTCPTTRVILSSNRAS